MLCWHWQEKKLFVTGMLVWVVLSAGCNRGKEPPPAPTQSPGEQTNTATAPTPEAPPATKTTGALAARGIVLASRELGMSVSGPGASNPGRALDVLERQINVFLPEIRNAYESARAQDPALMGSFDVSMMIEANGGVSEVRFPVKRVSNDRLTAMVFDEMRNWMFPQADLESQLRFTMLFVPPGMDEASILLWEKRLGSRPVIEKSGDTVPPVAVAAARPPEKDDWDVNSRKRQGEPLAKMTLEEKSTTVTKEPAPTTPPQANKGKSGEEEITGWYRVLYPSMLRAEPLESAKAITRLQKGTRIRVVRIIRGQWLEVRSISNRPPGFLWWEDAVAEREERAEQR